MHCNKNVIGRKLFRISQLSGCVNYLDILHIVCVFLCCESLSCEGCGQPTAMIFTRMTLC